MANLNTDGSNANPPAGGEANDSGKSQEEMVPKADLLRVQGEKGELNSKLQAAIAAREELQAKHDALNDRLEMLEKRGVPASDDERKRIEDEELRLRQRERELTRREESLKGQMREASLAGLAAKYPNVTLDELRAQAENLNDADLRVYAVEKHYERAAKNGNANGNGDGKPAPPNGNRVDTPGNGGGNTSTRQLSSREKREQGLAERRRDYADLYRVADAAP